jgi:hypothetical protein
MAGYDRRMNPWENLTYGVLRPLVCRVRGHRGNWWGVVADDDFSVVTHEIRCCRMCTHMDERPVTR